MRMDKSAQTLENVDSAVVVPGSVGLSNTFSRHQLCCSTRLAGESIIGWYNSLDIHHGHLTTKPVSWTTCYPGALNTYVHQHTQIDIIISL